MATSTVRPDPQPSGGWSGRSRARCARPRRHRRGCSSRPRMALAVTRVSPCSRPSWQPAAQPLDRVARGAGRHHDVVALDRDVEAAGVVGPRVEGAAARQVEPGVVPVTGEQAGLDRSPVQREAEVRAAVLDRPGPSLVPQDHDRQGRRPWSGGAPRPAARPATRPGQLCPRPAPLVLVRSIVTSPRRPRSLGPAPDVPSVPRFRQVCASEITAILAGASVVRCQAADRRSPEARRVGDRAGAGGRLRPHRHRGAPAPRDPGGERAGRAGALATARRAGPSAGALAAHGHRRRALPRPSRRPHRRADRLDPRRARARRGSSGCWRRVARPSSRPTGRRSPIPPSARCRSGCGAWPRCAAPRATWPR